MVVTRSRLHAVRYQQSIEAYIAEKGYRDLHALVAFSGKVQDRTLTGKATGAACSRRVEGPHRVRDRPARPLPAGRPRAGPPASRDRPSLSRVTPGGRPDDRASRSSEQAATSARQVPSHGVGDPAGVTDRPRSGSPGWTRRLRGGRDPASTGGTLAAAPGGPRRRVDAPLPRAGRQPEQRRRHTADACRAPAWTDSPAPDAASVPPASGHPAGRPTTMA